MSAAARGGRSPAARSVTALLIVACLTLIAPIVAAAPEGGHGERWIVQLKPGTGSASFVGRAAAQLGVRPTHVFEHAANGFAAQLTTPQRRALLASPLVVSIQPDMPTTIAADPQPVPPGVQRVGADPSAIRSVDGSDPLLPVDIAILDTGIDKSHPDLRLVGGKNCTTTTSSWERDVHGHGTHVAGIAAARDNGLGVVGVAAGARLWSVKVLNNYGNGYASWLICGLDWVAAQRDPDDLSQPRIEVANMSLRMTGSDDGNCGLWNADLLHQAICRLDRAGVAVVAAAGNDSKNASKYTPAAYEESITVSAMADYDGQPGGLASPLPSTECSRQDADDTFAGFSNFGPDVDLIAPGVCVLSTFPGNTYARMSGTSMATPLVSAGVALYHLHEASAGRPRPTPQGARVALLASGSTAWRSGTDPDSEHEPLLDVSSLQLEPAFELGLSPQVQHRGPGDMATLDIWLARLGGFDGDVELSVSGLPTGAQSSIAASTFAGTDSGWRALTIELPATGGIGAHDIVVAASAAGQPTRSAKARLYVEEGITGASGAPRVSLRSGVASEQVKLPITVRWSAVKNAQRYELQVSRDGSPWAAVTLPSKTATIVNRLAWPGSTYRYRVRVKKDGSWGSWLLGRPTIVTPHFAGKAVTLSGSWMSFTDSDSYADVPAYSTEADATAALHFTGRSVSWITSRGPRRGKARIYVDGVLAAKVDLFASSLRHRRVVFSRSWATAEEHTIVVQVVGTSGRPRVDVDAIVVVGTD